MLAPSLHPVALDLVRVTEAAAIASAAWTGRGDGKRADKAAVDAMRSTLAAVNVRGTVVIGEGEKDAAPMLFNGEQVGAGTGLEVDIAVDPLEGTTLCVGGLPNSISIIAIAGRGAMFFPGPALYMDKVVAGPGAADAIDLDAPAGENVRRVARALGKRPSDVSVYLLDRDRHAGLIMELRSAGARIRLLPAGDTAPAIAAAGIGIGEVDLVMGIGGSPEAVIVAAAMRCLGGAIRARPWPRTDAERAAILAAGYDLTAVLTETDLVGGGDVLVAATGVTSGQLLRGVSRHPAGPDRVAGGARTDSLVLHAGTGSWRRIESNLPPAAPVRPQMA
jgi:fructose-1,6-bisphosphatase II